MMVKRSGSLVEAASVPRVRESETLKIQMVAELVTEGAEECPEGRDLLADSRPHPHADQHGFWSVVSEQFARPVFTDSKRSGSKYANPALGNFVEL
jgi:hypothetical protein